jgi:hypothetical protein
VDTVEKRKTSCPVGNWTRTPWFTSLWPVITLTEVSQLQKKPESQSYLLCTFSLPWSIQAGLYMFLSTLHLHSYICNS